MLVHGEEILDFSLSNPAKAGFPANIRSEFPDLPSGAEAFGYEPEPRGLLSARVALCERFASRGVTMPVQDIFLGASTSEAYGWIFKLLCDPGDAILVPKPGYPLFDYLAGLESVETISYRLEYDHPAGWSVDIADLARALDSPRGGRAKAIVLINPNNPTGSYIRAAERDAILELCERRGLALISDEVFFDFELEARPGRRSLAGEDRVLVFTLDGLSKLAGLPGFKLAWTAISGPAAELREASSRLEIIADSYLSAGTPVMLALPSILRASKSFVDAARARMAANLAILRETLEMPGSPHRVLRCEGGWTALLQSPRLETEEALARGLLSEMRVWIHPGYFFDMEREAYFAASLISPPERTRECARRYLEFFDRLLAL
jgi:aspartate/methionine/tyrosine aminotransferase